MVQAKAKRSGSSVRKFLAGVRRGYLPWLTQSIRRWRPDAVGSAISAMREVHISRQRLRRPERHGPMLEPLEQRLYLSALPTPFANMDIGAPAIAGSAIYVSANNQWQATGAGTGVAGTADQFNYTAENWTGSGSLSANVGSVADTGTNAQAGVMICDTSAAGSEFAAVMENSNGTISLEYRNNTSAAVTVAAITSGAVNPAWVRLSEAQSGTTDSFTGLYSTDGVTWTALNATPINISFTQSTNLAGLAVTSGNAGQSQTVNYNSFSATSANFTDQDIGSPSIAGSADFNGATWTVSGSGTDIWNSSDQFNFASQSWTGDGSIIAEVTSQTDTSPYAKAGVMFRDSNAAGSMQASVLVTPTNGVVFEWRNASNGSSDVTYATGVTSPVWVKLTRAGERFSAFYSTDGTTWTQIGSTQTIAFSNSANLAGLAVTAMNTSALSTATFTNVGVTAATLWNAATVSSNSTVNPGTVLDITNGLSFQNGAALTIDAGAMVNFINGTSPGQTISGSGSIVLQGAGGSYGPAQMAVDGAAGSSVTFANGVNIQGQSENAVMDVGAGNTLIFNDTISQLSLNVESGGFLKTGGPTTVGMLDNLTLDSSPTLLGPSDVDVSDGLGLGNGATLTVQAGATLNFMNGATNTQTVYGVGAIVLDGAGGGYAAAQLNLAGTAAGS